MLIFPAYHVPAYIRGSASLSRLTMEFLFLFVKRYLERFLDIWSYGGNAPVERELQIIKVARLVCDSQMKLWSTISTHLSNAAKIC